jgi:acetylornithine deacetylase
MARSLHHLAPSALTLDDAIEELLPDAVKLLELLVAQPSTLGNERGAQEMVETALRDLGFDSRWVAIDDAIGDDPTAGVPPRSYAGRGDLVMDRAAGAYGPHLLINGHIDVVPADEAAQWTSHPFEPVIREGWLHGRGAGDMKGGFAMTALAISALDRVHPGWQAGRLSLLAAIEEECTGNGTLAALRSGLDADAVFLPEPTDLRLLLGGVGILWFEIEITGHSAHAELADRAINPIEVAFRILPGLRAWERELNAALDDPLFAEGSHPYNLNIGTFHAGDWQSSVPAVARVGCRLGFPRAWTPAQAESEVRTILDQLSRADAWLADHPLAVRFNGFRAKGYALPVDSPLARAVAAAHQDAHGAAPEAAVLGTTTDARIHIIEGDTPAICYGPRTRNIHGIDEAVEIESIALGARTMARFLRAFYADPTDGRFSAGGSQR